MNELNLLTVAERAVFADLGGGGELAQDSGMIIERARLSSGLRFWTHCVQNLEG